MIYKDNLEKELNELILSTKLPSGLFLFQKAPSEFYILNEKGQKIFEKPFLGIEGINEIFFIGFSKSFSSPELISKNKEIFFKNKYIEIYHTDKYLLCHKEEENIFEVFEMKGNTIVDLKKTIPVNPFERENINKNTCDLSENKNIEWYLKNNY